MDILEVFNYIFGLISLLYIFHMGFYLTGASLYDIWQYRRASRIASGESGGRHYSVTVLVPAHNEELVVVRCLDSIVANHYAGISIIVVDDASTDSTFRVLRGYKRDHPDLPLRIIRKRKNAGKGGALNYAMRHYVDTDLVMMLDADSVLAPQAIERAVSYFNDPWIAGVAANVQVMNRHTTLSVLQKFEHMIGYRSKKVYSITNCEFVVGGVASTYRMDILRQVKFYDTTTMTEDIGLSMKIVAIGNRLNRVIYASDVVAMTEPVDSFSGLLKQRYRWKYGSLQNLFKYRYLMERTDERYTTMLTQYRLPMAFVSELMLLLLPLMWAYALFLTFDGRSLVLVIGAYMTTTIYIFLTLWQDENIRFGERLYLTLYIPIAYFIFYIMDIIQLCAVIRCAWHMRKLASQQAGNVSWVSPKRLGGGMEVTG